MNGSPTSGQFIVTFSKPLEVIDQTLSAVLLESQHPEAVVALRDPLHANHSTVRALAQTARARRAKRGDPVHRQMVVPIAVRVESGWDRTNSSWAGMNGLPVQDETLDATAGNRAAGLRAALHSPPKKPMSVADAHLGAAMTTGDVIVTSDAGAISRMASHRGVAVTVVRV